MAKYCVKCGKALPEGVEICPDCNAAAAQERDAALFTHMSSDTEVWKTADPVKRKKGKAKRSRSARQMLWIYISASVLVIAAAVLILFGQPAARIARALRSGDIDHASAVYWSTPRLYESEQRSEKVDAAIMEAAQKLCEQYANHELDADTAASRLAKLGTFGDASAAMLADTYAEFRAFSTSRGHMSEAEKLYAGGDYLAARAEYLLVLDTDADYQTAQTLAEDCLTQYGRHVAEEAESLMAKNDFPGAIAALKSGDAVLSEEYGTFSADIDTLLPESYDRFEAYLLAETNNLSELEDYEAAAAMLRDALDVFPAPRDALNAALEKYQTSARAKRLENAGVRADEQYAAGAYAAAFALLEDFAAQPGEDSDGAQALIEAMERRYGEDRCAAAEAAFDGKRENLEKAITLLDDAWEIRPVTTIDDYRTELESYLPLNLVEAEYAEKNGTVFRSAGDFLALNGRTYTEGWIWGEDGAELSFSLDGAYDLLECKFVDRRDDDEEVSGSFEIWCDGEKVFTSETLVHPQVDGQSVSVDVSGCSELKIVFLCDYEVSTTENGFCYHGICNPTLTKNI